MKLQFIPHDHFRIRTKYSVEQMQYILWTHIAQDYLGEKEFWGWRYEDSFKIMPLRFKGWNSSVVLEGKLLQADEGITMEVAVRLKRFIQIWLAMWSISIIVFFPLYLMGWGVTTVVFWIEASYAKERMHEIFGYPIENVKKQKRSFLYNSNIRNSEKEG